MQLLRARLGATVLLPKWVTHNMAHGNISMSAALCSLAISACSSGNSGQMPSPPVQNIAAGSASPAPMPNASSISSTPIPASAPSSQPVPSSPPPVPPGSSTYPGKTLVWDEEFTYTGAPSPGKWSYEVGTGPPYPGWGNNELEFYTNDPANVNVKNGVLNITAIHETFQGAQYTSAKILSTQSWKYGRFDIMAKIPTVTGTWPAIWMMPTQPAYGAWPNSGEIDIMENVGFNPSTIYGTLHMAGGQPGGHVTVATDSTAFHLYSMDWEPDRITFLVDGAAYETYQPTATQLAQWQSWPFTQPFHLILNLAVGGNWGGQRGVNASAFPQTMQVQYVRVYQ